MEVMLLLLPNSEIGVLWLDIGILLVLIWKWKSLWVQLLPFKRLRKLTHGRIWSIIAIGNLIETIYSLNVLMRKMKWIYYVFIYSLQRKLTASLKLLFLPVWWRTRLLSNSRTRRRWREWHLSSLTNRTLCILHRATQCIYLSLFSSNKYTRLQRALAMQILCWHCGLIMILVLIWILRLSEHLKVGVWLGISVVIVWILNGCRLLFRDGIASVVHLLDCSSWKSLASLLVAEYPMLVIVRIASAIVIVRYESEILIFVQLLFQGYGISYRVLIVAIQGCIVLWFWIGLVACLGLSWNDKVILLHL